MSGVAGVIDVGVNLENRGHAATVTATLRVGADSIAQTQTVAASSGSTAASNLAFTLNTAAFSAATGAPLLHNGLATLTITATTNTAPAQSNSSSFTFLLANP